MKSLKLYGIQDLRFEKANKPTVENANDVIVKVQAVGVCGSDISRYNKLGPYIEGMVWGHELSGEVVEVGDAVSKVKVGDRIAGVPSLVCEDLDNVEECYFCKKSEYARCENLTVIGARHPGGFAQYIKLPSKNCVLIPESVDYKSASMIEPTSVVLHGYYKTRLAAGHSLVVVGCGNIGLLSIKLAKIFGATQIIAVDIVDNALEHAKKAGATHVINSMKENTLEKIESITNGLMVDLTIEAAGSAITSAEVFAYSKKGGEVLFLGIPYADVNVERFYFEKIMRSELTVLGAWNCISGPFPGKEWTTAVELLSSGELEVASLITHDLELKEGPKIFDQLINSDSKNFGKIVLRPN